jgi:hypothetical protein
VNFGYQLFSSYLPLKYIKAVRRFYRPRIERYLPTFKGENHFYSQIQNRIIL